MIFSISWSPTALHTYHQILDYLETSWSEKEILAFVKRTNQILNYIALNPLLYPASKKKSGIHRCIIVKQVSLFYRIKNNDIELLQFWNNRMDPSKIKLY